MVLEPPRRWPRPNVREVLKSRDLIYFLARRDVMVRYKQAVVGVFWVILQPVMLAAIFSVFLGPAREGPAPRRHPLPGCFVALRHGDLAGVLGGGPELTESTVANEPLISKIYFPRMAIPSPRWSRRSSTSSSGSSSWSAPRSAYGYAPGLELLAAPARPRARDAPALGFGLWLSALNVKYRDVSPRSSR